MAGRDLIGYGPNSPVVEWPNGARIAVSFVVNYEEGSENSILDGDPHGETVGESPSPVARGERDLANESFFEYGSRVGVWRILDLLDEYGRSLRPGSVGPCLPAPPVPSSDRRPSCVVLLSVILLDTDKNHTVAGFVNDLYLHTSWDSTAFCEVGQHKLDLDILVDHLAQLSYHGCVEAPLQPVSDKLTRHSNESGPIFHAQKHRGLQVSFIGGNGDLFVQLG